MKNLWSARANLKKAGLDVDMLEIMFEGYMEDVELPADDMVVWGHFEKMLYDFCLMSLIDDATWGDLETWFDSVAIKYVS